MQIEINGDAATIIDEAIGNSDAVNPSDVIIGMQNLINKLIAKIDAYEKYRKARPIEET